MRLRVIGGGVVICSLFTIGVVSALHLADDVDPDLGARAAAGEPVLPTVGPTSAVTTGEAGAEPTTSSTASPTTTQAPVVPIASIRLTTERVATVKQPVDLATRRGDERLYVAEQTGRVQAVRPGAEPQVVLDLSSEVSNGYEQGLLGLEFSPDGAFLYSYHTDVQGDTRVLEWAMTSNGPDPGSRREILFVDQPYPNHNGGALEYGPDGYLYISLGDGGDGGDPHGNAQNLGVLLGKILRIHPRPTQGSPYAAPSGNPFLDRAGARGEIWAYGLRNPWRITFDRATGDLWIADVGQGRIEEINFQPGESTGGENYGWDRFEGSLPFEGDPPAKHVLPIHEYPLGGGNCAVTGGYVYRGSRIPDLNGIYLFADFCAGEVMGLRQSGGRSTEAASLGLTIPSLSSFGEDENGELYALSLSGDVLRIVSGANQ